MRGFGREEIGIRNGGVCSPTPALSASTLPLQLAPWHSQADHLPRPYHLRSSSPTGRPIWPLTYSLTHLAHLLREDVLGLSLTYLLTYLHSSSPTGRRIGPPASARLSRTSSPGGQARPSHRLPQRHAPEALHWRVRARASTLRGAGSEPSRLGYRIYRGLTSATSTLRCRGRGTGFTRRSRSRLRELSRELISELITLPLEAGQEADAMCSGLWAGWCWLCGSYMDHAGKVSYKL